MKTKLIEDILLLYVEDDDDVRTMTERYLKRKVKDVIVACNGQEGYDMYLKHKPDMIISDIKMPVMSGLEMSSIIRDENKTIPIIIVSAHSEVHLFQEAISIGINTYLLKPIDLMQLYCTIKMSRDNVLLKKQNHLSTQLVSNQSSEIKEINTELEEAIEKLKDIQNKLLESDKLASIGKLVTGLAHELNTPIGIGISSVTYLIEETKKIKSNYENNLISQEDFEKYLASIQELSTITYLNLDRSAHLIKSFKQVSSSQANELKVKFNLKEYIQETLLSISNITKKTNIDIKLKCDENINIYSLPGDYSQIITNLILNSINHGYDKKQKGKILIDVFRKDNSLNMIYKDDGKGIPKENLPKIFNMFFSTKDTYGSNGIGLNVIYNMIKNDLNGSITCDSKKGEGVVFTITIPLK